MQLRTDLAIVQLPATLPNWGGFLGKNAVQKDPDFGTQILRLTDGGDVKGMSMQTGDSGQDGIWNVNDTLILCRSTGSSSFLYQFNPSKFEGKFLGNKFRGKVCFSRVLPGVIFEVVGTQIIRHKFVCSNGLWIQRPDQILCDFSDILPDAPITWTGSFLVSQADNTFCIGFSTTGAQNSGTFVCVYETNEGMRMLDTSTGIVTGDWGETGIVRLTSSDTQIPFTLHECSQTPNPEYAQIGAFKGGDSPIFWNIPTLNLVDSNSSGHGAKGYTARYAGGPGGGQLKKVPYDDPTNTSLVVHKENLPDGYKGDSHFGFGPLALSDDSIIWASGQTDISPFTSAWMNELRGYDVAQGIVYRACHTFNSGRSSNFSVANAMSAPSQTGKFVAFTSDAMGSLGNLADGTPRGDVFIVRVA